MGEFDLQVGVLKGSLGWDAKLVNSNPSFLREILSYDPLVTDSVLKGGVYWKGGIAFPGLSQHEGYSGFQRCANGLSFCAFLYQSDLFHV